MLEAINKSFGSFEKFKADFTDKALTQFGSGWAWLVKKGDGSLAVTQTPNADLPMKHGQKALLTCDVWEHAYYIDYRNLRAKYVESFWSLVNWDFVQQNLESR
jgi:Fe-Mn family superoxide dismutase